MNYVCSAIGMTVCNHLLAVNHDRVMRQFPVTMRGILQLEDNEEQGIA